MSEKQIERMRDFLKPRMSKKRFIHSVNVAYEAVKLARKYGVDENRAFIAGYLHDCAKELDSDKQRELMDRSDFPVDEVEKNSGALFHAVAGAVVIKEEFGIEDMIVLEAVRYHTVAAPAMSSLAQIVYLADLISADRSYKDVKRMRKVSYESLNGAMLEALRFSIADSVKKGNCIPQSTLLAYNEYITKAKISKNDKDKNEKREND